MKQLSKLGAVLLAACMALSLAACKKNDSSAFDWADYTPGLSALAAYAGAGNMQKLPDGIKRADFSTDGLLWTNDYIQVVETGAVINEEADFTSVSGTAVAGYKAVVAKGNDWTRVYDYDGAPLFTGNRLTMGEPTEMVRNDCPGLYVRLTDGEKVAYAQVVNGYLRGAYTEEDMAGETDVVRPARTPLTAVVAGHTEARPDERLAAYTFSQFTAGAEREYVFYRNGAEQSRLRPGADWNGLFAYADGKIIYATERTADSFSTDGFNYMDAVGEKRMVCIYRFDIDSGKTEEIHPDYYIDPAQPPQSLYNRKTGRYDLLAAEVVPFRNGIAAPDWTARDLYVFNTSGTVHYKASEHPCGVPVLCAGGNYYTDSGYLAAPDGRRVSDAFSFVAVTDDRFAVIREGLIGTIGFDSLVKGGFTDRPLFADAPDLMRFGTFVPVTDGEREYMFDIATGDKKRISELVGSSEYDFAGRLLQLGDEIYAYDGRLLADNLTQCTFTEYATDGGTYVLYAFQAAETSYWLMRV